MKTILSLFALALTLGLAPSIFAQDGAPHIAIVDDQGVMAVEFEIGFGFDDSADPPTITLDTSVYDTAFPGYRTFPLNTTPSPNDDLGFVSEVEGSSEEGGTISGNIVIRLLNKTSNFAAVLGSTPLFTDADPDFELGSSFDTHPIWLALNAQGDTTPASATFEIFDISPGSIGSGAASLGQFNLVLAVPEPTTAGAFALLAGLTTCRGLRRK